MSWRRGSGAAAILNTSPGVDELAAPDAVLTCDTGTRQYAARYLTMNGRVGPGLLQHGSMANALPRPSALRSVIRVVNRALLAMAARDVDERSALAPAAEAAREDRRVSNDALAFVSWK